MIRSTTACLLFLLCLLTLPGSSQAIAPLAPAVVRLQVGDVARRPLIGLDTATYRSTRLYVAGASQLLDVRAQRIAQLERSTRLADSTTAATSAELRRCRATSSANEADFQKLATTTRAALGKPPAPPLLLDPHFYQGTLAGTVAAALLKLFVFH